MWHFCDLQDWHWRVRIRLDTGHWRRIAEFGSLSRIALAGVILW